MKSDALILSVKSNETFHNLIPKNFVKKLIRSKMEQSARCVNDLQEVVIMTSMILTKNSQLRLLFKKKLSKL